MSSISQCKLPALVLASIFFFFFFCLHLRHQRVEEGGKEAGCISVAEQVAERPCELFKEALLLQDVCKRWC